MMQLPSVRTGENKLRPLLLPTADSNARAQGRPVQIYLREGGHEREREADLEILPRFEGGLGNKGIARVGLRRFIVRVSLPYSIKKATATYLLRRCKGKKSWKDRDR